MLKVFSERKLKEVLSILLHYTHLYMREFNYPYIQRVDHNKWVICKAFPQWEFARKCTVITQIPGLFQIKYLNEIEWVLALRPNSIWVSAINEGTAFITKEKAQ